MNISLINTLKSVEKYPSVSILLPTHRTLPDNEKDKTLIKNLVKDAEQRLLAEYSKRELSPLLNRLEALADSIDVRHNLDGLGLFVNEDMAEFIRLPFPIRSRVIIDKTFATRDLIMGMNRSHEYFLLSVSSTQIRLFEAVRDELMELTLGDFPIDISDLKVSSHQQSMNMDQQKLKEAFNQADKSLQQVYNGQALPVVIAGVDERISWFMEIADRKEIFKLKVTGNYDKHTVHDFGKAVWPMVKEAFAKLQDDLIEELGNARGVQKQASGLQAVWALASEGRIEKLLVEEDYHQAGKVAHNGQISLIDDAEQAKVSDDIVDELVELVVEKGGEVHFVANGRLEDYGQVAAILRF
jgi:hypothetical protein